MHLQRAGHVLKSLPARLLFRRLPLFGMIELTVAKPFISVLKSIVTILAITVLALQGPFNPGPDSDGPSKALPLVTPLLRARAFWNQVTWLGSVT